MALNIEDRFANELAIILIALPAIVLVWKYFIHRLRRPLLPPGPKSLPILGNLLDLPKEHPWIQWHQWSELYGTAHALHLRRWTN
jgi:hypothetical protein